MNKAFLLLQDFELTNSFDDPRWVLLTSSNLPDEAPKPNVAPPLEDVSSNDFAGLSFDDINTFIRSNESKIKALDLTIANWVIIDQKGIDSSTCLVVDQVYDSEADSDDGGGEGRMTDDFKAARVPYTQAWAMFANLDITNMDFEEWVDEDAGVQEDGAYKWVGPFPASTEHQEQADRDAEIKRERALKAMRDLGYID